MADRVKEPMDQPKVNPRANLFYLLQTLSRVAEAGNRAGVQSEVSDEPTAESNANGTQG